MLLCNLACSFLGHWAVCCSRPCGAGWRGDFFFFKALILHSKRRPQNDVAEYCCKTSMISNDGDCTIIRAHQKKKKKDTVSIIVNQQNRFCPSFLPVAIQASPHPHHTHRDTHTHKRTWRGLASSLPGLALGLPGLVRTEAEIFSRNREKKKRKAMQQKTRAGKRA